MKIMSYIEDIQNRKNEVRNNIAKGFGCEFVKAQDDEFGEIEKAVYADTAQNRKTWTCWPRVSPR